MTGFKLKRKSRLHLSAGQTCLLKESVKKLLGPGLGQAPTFKNEKELRLNFLREALSTRLLDSEWMA
jgi:hypothetical protein